MSSKYPSALRQINLHIPIIRNNLSVFNELLSTAKKGLFPGYLILKMF